MTESAGYFAEGLIVRGQIEGQGNLEVAGRIEGPVSLRGDLHVAPTGALLGHVQGHVVAVEGVIRGEITAQEARIGAGGRAIGDVRASRVALDDGGVLDGSIHMNVALPQELQDGEPS